MSRRPEAARKRGADVSRADDAYVHYSSPLRAKQRQAAVGFTAALWNTGKKGRMARWSAIAVTAVVCAALVSCTPHGSSAKGQAARQTVNCENGYTQQHRQHNVTAQCAHSGAMSSSKP
jgi:hypothetical protein